MTNYEAHQSQLRNGCLRQPQPTLVPPISKSSEVEAGVGLRAVSALTFNDLAGGQTVRM